MAILASPIKSALAELEQKYGEETMDIVKTILVISCRDPFTISEILSIPVRKVYGDGIERLDSHIVAKIASLELPMLAESLNGILAIALNDGDFETVVGKCLSMKLDNRQLFCVAQAVYFRGLNRGRCLAILPTWVIAKLGAEIDLVLSIQCAIHLKCSNAIVLQFLQSLSRRGTSRQVVMTLLDQHCLYGNLAERLAESERSPELVGRLNALAKTKISDSRKWSIGELIRSIDTSRNEKRENCVHDNGTSTPESD